MRIVRSPFTTADGPRRTGLVLAVLFLLAARSGETQGLQQDINAASPGDTVLVPPGGYSRTITVHKAVTLLAEGPGDARFAQIDGSLATLIGLVFDSTLQSMPGTAVAAGDSLTLIDCRFDGGLRGVEIAAGAKDIALLGCSMTGPLEGIAFHSGLGSLRVENCALEASLAALAGPDTLICDPPTPRAPAGRCDGAPCGDILVQGSTLTGGQYQIQVAGAYRLAVTGSTLSGAGGAGVRAAGARIEIERTTISGIGIGTGLALDSVSGFVRSCRILSFDRGLAVGDGGCDRYSDLEIGGTIDFANDIGGGTVVFHLAQPESVNAELNFWGTTDCLEVLTHISGQRVNAVTDDNHQGVFLCGSTAAQPLTWGRLKQRYRDEAATKP